MNKCELIQELGNEADFPLKKADEVVDLVFGEMGVALAKGDRVEIRGFGSLKVKHYRSFMGRNPKTLEKFEVKPQKLPFFKCGREFKWRVDSRRNSG